MKEIVISILLFVSAFALFPYVGMILSSTCDHSPTVAATGRWLHRKHAAQLTEIQSRYLFQAPASELNGTVTDIIEDQNMRQETFCSTTDANTTVYKNKLVADLYHHLLVDDARKIVFCYVPKVACSNWKRVFLIFANLVDPDGSLRPSIDIFRQVKSMEDYSPSEQEYRLRNYFKFMFVRNPIERLVSAYRNKIEHPTSDNPSERTIWDGIRAWILQKHRGPAQGNNVTDPPYPTFSEFIHFLGASDPADMNEHYKPMTALCQPCSVHYNYVGNFATLRRDANRILQYLHINTSWFWDRGKHFSNPTNNYVNKYYSKLTSKDIEIIEKVVLVDDIQLYEHLFPSV
ncbi:Carbohydrate sulfotransferase 14 [Geodia barretti]|uniref:Carbohydrate sulfotransferase n=1 Tax=Geodia barretti TaxID=519541 RepID=A0AA35SV34_GEOBA|nr:Carbohydrate sulfotransferase 14 [Geodia barretti]